MVIPRCHTSKDEGTQHYTTTIFCASQRTPPCNVHTTPTSGSSPRPGLADVGQDTAGWGGRLLFDRHLLIHADIVHALQIALLFILRLQRCAHAILLISSDCTAAGISSTCEAESLRCHTVCSGETVEEHKFLLSNSFLDDHRY